MSMPAEKSWFHVVLLGALLGGAVVAGCGLPPGGAATPTQPVPMESPTPAPTAPPPTPEPRPPLPSATVTPVATATAFLVDTPTAAPTPGPATEVIFRNAWLTDKKTGWLLCQRCQAPTRGIPRANA